MADQKRKRRGDPLKWIATWLAKRQAKYVYQTEGVILDGQEISKKRLINELVRYAYKGGTNFKENLLKAALDLWLDNESRVVVQDAKNRLAHHPVGDDQLRAWVKAVTGDEKPLHVAIVKHFIWQVKRKLFEMPVEFHLMPVFHGPQESGKSTAIRRLLEPLQEVVDLGGLETLTDERNAFRLARFYVMFVDEMEGATRAEIDKVKNTITADKIAWRVLGLNARDAGPQRITFIGASNKTVPELLNDPTGMRRFAQIDTPAKCDWAAVNAFQPLAVWQSVDEKAPSPILPFRDELKAHQGELVGVDPVNVFVESMLKRLTGTNKETWMESAALYQAYSGWCRQMNQYPVSMTAFGSRMKKILGDAGWVKSGVVRYAVALDANSPLGQHYLQKAGASAPQ
ncbi:MAG: virulence-associated E family protein [Myxococcaceae bacterium]|nr:virulence-associated E family protein [Myxococcaceae bacterium]